MAKRKKATRKPKGRRGGKRRGAGRPRAFDARLRRKVLAKLAKGHSFAEAVVLIGVHYTTLCKERHEDTTFDEAVKAAYREGRIRAKAKARGTILGAIERDWRAALAYLERLYPEEWSKHRHVTHEGEIEVNHVADLSHVRRELLADAAYLEFLRNQALAIDGHARTIRQNGQQGPLEDGPSARGDGPRAG